MAFGFKKFVTLAPAAFVIKAILAAVAADVVLLGFILLRRGYRRWYFRRRDARVIEIRQQWESLVQGEIPFETWRNNPRDCQIVESFALDAFETADCTESALILKFLRTSGLIAKFTFEARRHRGWRRREAMVALGRTRAPEAIPVLSDALRDKDPETRLAAVRALERMSCPEAGKELLNWMAESGLTVPALPMQSALLQCCAERPQMLISYLQHAHGATREILARVLGEIATPGLQTSLLQFVDDELPELRAAAARALSHSDSQVAIASLTELSADPIWFVRLRAFVSLGELRSAAVIPVLLRGLSDAKRLVRLRAGEALLKADSDQTAILRRVVGMKDRYGIDAYVTALDNAGLMPGVRAKVMEFPPSTEKESLIEILGHGIAQSENAEPGKAALAKAAFSS